MDNYLKTTFVQTDTDNLHYNFIQINIGLERIIMKISVTFIIMLLIGILYVNNWIDLWGRWFLHNGCPTAFYCSVGVWVKAN